MQYIFLVPSPNTGVKSLRFAKVCDKVSVADIDPPRVATICDSLDSVSTLTVAGMLKTY